MKETLNANAQAVLEAVRSSHNHPTALEIYEAVRKVRPRIGVASVYRILHSLAQQGLIRELGRSDEACRYDGHIERHDHAICTTCGALLDLPVDVRLSEEALRMAAQAAGIELHSHEVRLYGQCAACRQKAQTEQVRRREPPPEAAELE
uniref:Transcriptional repressor n=1 Tax=Thermogemmatispora argillosa TaxID=2045280 RepID=A0A455T3R1_9CHLR|nr:transcriptional repressor [Thermogemmatispora argillosa]